MSALPAVTEFDSSVGAKIYRIPMVVFPNGFVGYSYLVLNLGQPFLVDTGSGLGDSNTHLLEGIAAVRHNFGVNVTPRDIDMIFITHGHIDHFGGLAFIAAHTGAKIGIHPLDRRVLTNYEERVVMATKDLKIYLERAGTSPERRAEMLALYGFAKKHVCSVAVDFDLDDAVSLHGLRVIHTPGHCSGQVCLLIGDVLLSGDHILSFTTPHQAPESITHYTGLGHYRESLQKIAQVDGIRLALGGHEESMYDVYSRIDEIEAGHSRKLNRVLDIIKQAGRPCTIDEITQTMYPDKTSYEIILAVEEAGAHVEYLYQRGMLAVANLDEVEREDNPALCYAVV